MGLKYLLDDPVPTVEATNVLAIVLHGLGKTTWRWVAAVIGVLSVTISLQVKLQLNGYASYTELFSTTIEITAPDTTSFQASLGVAKQYLYGSGKRGTDRTIQLNQMQPLCEIGNQSPNQHRKALIQMKTNTMSTNLAATFHSSVGNDTMSTSVMLDPTDRHPVPTVEATNVLAIVLHGLGKTTWRWVAAVIGVLSVTISLQVKLQLNGYASYTV